MKDEGQKWNVHDKHKQILRDLAHICKSHSIWYHTPFFLPSLLNCRNESLSWGVTYQMEHQTERRLERLKVCLFFIWNVSHIGVSEMYWRNFNKKYPSITYRLEYHSGYLMERRLVRLKERLFLSWNIGDFGVNKVTDWWKSNKKCRWQTRKMQRTDAMKILFFIGILFIWSVCKFNNCRSLRSLTLQKSTTYSIVFFTLLLKVYLISEALQSQCYFDPYSFDSYCTEWFLYAYSKLLNQFFNMKATDSTHHLEHR